MTNQVPVHATHVNHNFLIKTDNDYADYFELHADRIAMHHFGKPYAHYTNGFGWLIAAKIHRICATEYSTLILNQTPQS